MKEWLQTGMYQVNSLLRKDQDFQNLMQRLEIASKDYQRILSKLSPEEKLIIENYIALCEEIEYQKTFTAYYCGKRNG